MGAMSSQITSNMVVYSAVYSGADQRKQQSSPSLAFAGNLPVTSKFPAQMASNVAMLPFDNGIMEIIFRSSIYNINPSLCPNIHLMSGDALQVEC